MLNANKHRLGTQSLGLYVDFWFGLAALLAEGEGDVLL